MTKKSFKDTNPAMAFITSMDEKTTHDAQEVQPTHDAQPVQSLHPTQGKKGKKLQRINMAFGDDNIAYLRLISRLEGISMTQYVNLLIEADMGLRADKIEKAKELLK